MFKVGDRVIVSGEGADCGRSANRRNGLGIIEDAAILVQGVRLDTGVYVCAKTVNVSHYVDIITPPQKIQKNGYEYSLVGPVKPEWLVDGAWVVNAVTEHSYQIIEGEPGLYRLKRNGKTPFDVSLDRILNNYRPHTASDWKWGDWAMYMGKRVFVMSSLTHDNLVGVSFPNIDGKDLTDPSEQWDFAGVSELTPTF